LTSSPTIHLVLADDWELRGDGSGNMRAMQFQTLRRLLEIYERHGLRASINAEVMQQLWHRRLAEQHGELAELAGEWEAIVTDAYAGGHDVQLHVHPQWSDARYEEGRWRLSGNWSILDYSSDDVRGMLSEAKAYLEALLAAVDSGYRCRSFRSGSWAIGPGAHVLSTLAELGIVVDISIAAGLHYETDHLSLDYRRIDEAFAPYYPRLDDARRVSPEPQPIVCVPTHTFRSSIRHLVLRALARSDRPLPLPRDVRSRNVAPSDTPVAGAGARGRDYAAQHWSRNSGRPWERARTAARRAVGLRVSDLGALTFAQMQEMLGDIRRRARLLAAPVVPAVLENHTKDLGDFEPIERFAAEVAAAPDLEIITLAELARNLQAGVYPIKTSRGA
jgi:hypothetical protein